MASGSPFVANFLTCCPYVWFFFYALELWKKRSPRQESKLPADISNTNFGPERKGRKKPDIVPRNAGLTKRNTSSEKAAMRSRPGCDVLCDENQPKSED
jgi:hypothetical protein